MSTCEHQEAVPAMGHGCGPYVAAGHGFVGTSYDADAAPLVRMYSYFNTAELWRCFSSCVSHIVLHHSHGSCLVRAVCGEKKDLRIRKVLVGEEAGLSACIYRGNNVSYFSLFHGN